MLSKVITFFYRLLLMIWDEIKSWVKENSTLATLIFVVFIWHILILILLEQGDLFLKDASPKKRIVVRTVSLSPAKPGQRGGGVKQTTSVSHPLPKIEHTETQAKAASHPPAREAPKPPSAKKEGAKEKQTTSVIAKVVEKSPSGASKVKKEIKETLPVSKTAKNKSIVSKAESSTKTRVTSKPLASAKALKKDPEINPEEVARQTKLKKQKEAAEEAIRQANLKKQREVEEQIHQTKLKKQKYAEELSALLRQASNTASKVENTSPEPKIETFFAIPEPITSLNIEGGEADGGSEGVSGYIGLLSGTLQNLITLPEEGVVKLKLTLQSNGTIKNISIYECDSPQNREYVLKVLSKSQLPSFQDYFSEAERTFPITLNASTK